MQVKQTSYQQAVFEQVERRVVKAAPSVVVVSPGYRVRLQERFADVLGDDIVVIRNGQTSCSRTRSPRTSGSGSTSTGRRSTHIRSTWSSTPSRASWIASAPRALRWSLSPDFRRARGADSRTGPRRSRAGRRARPRPRARRSPGRSASRRLPGRDDLERGAYSPRPRPVTASGSPSSRRPSRSWIARSGRPGRSRRSSWHRTTRFRRRSRRRSSLRWKTIRAWHWRRPGGSAWRVSAICIGSASSSRTPRGRRSRATGPSDTCDRTDVQVLPCRANFHASSASTSTRSSSASSDSSIPRSRASR